MAVNISAFEAKAPATTNETPATPAAPATDAFKLQVTGSADVPFWSGFAVAVVAPAGTGKTHLAATASESYPETWPPAAPVDVNDVLMIETDQNGLAPFREAGVTFKNVIDLSGAVAADYFKLCKTLPTFLNNHLKAHPEVKVVVFDHLSGFFEQVFWHILRVTKDGPAVYNTLAKEGKDLIFALKERVRVPIVYMSHIKKPAMHTEAMSGGAVIEMQQKVAAIASGVGRDQGDYAFAGKQLADVVRNSMTLSASLVAEELPGGKTGRKLVFAAGGDVFTKRRLTLCVGETEPAHLGKLFDKIAASVNSSWR